MAKGIYITKENCQIHGGHQTSKLFVEIYLDVTDLPCEYVFPLINLIINNQERFQTNADVHSVNTRNKHHLHRPTAS
jgi:hypothetical protein